MNFLYVILGVIALFILMQLSVRMRGKFRKGKPAPKVNGQLGKYIKNGDKVVAYFFSPSCSACRTQERYLPQVQEKFRNIVRINAGKERETASAFGVMGTPTTVIIEGGIIKDYFVGFTPPAKLLKSLGLT